jgi:hypothetical protein
MSESLTPSDARIKVMRHLEALFTEILEEDSDRPQSGSTGHTGTSGDRR